MPEDTMTPDVTATGPPPPQPETATPVANELPPQPMQTATLPGEAPTPQGGLQEQPQPMQSLPDSELHRQNWGTRIYHGILNALSGGPDMQYTTDETGKTVATPVAMKPGDQWKKIISGALTGYAAGAGQTGPGSTARKFGAGVQAGQKQAQQQDTQKREYANEDYTRQLEKKKTDASISLLTAQTARSQFETANMKVEASVAAAHREEDFTKLINDAGQGTTDLGVRTWDEAAEMFKNDPKLHAQLAGGDQGHLTGVPHVNAAGQFDGKFHMAVVTPAAMDQKTTTDYRYHYIDYDKDGKPVDKVGTIEKGSDTVRQRIATVLGQTKEEQDRAEKKAKEQREADLAKSTIRYQGQEGQHAVAEAAQAGAQTEEIKAKTAQINAATAAGVFPGGKSATAYGAPAGMDTIDAIGTGHIDLDRIGTILTKNPELIDAVVARYPDFDKGKVSTYVAARKDFTSGQTSKQIQAGSAAMNHLKHLWDLNTNASHIPHTNDWTAYQQQLTVAADELAKFYGTNTDTARRDLRDKLDATLPGNRFAAISTQVHSMGQLFDEVEAKWDRAIPSAAYKPKMPDISDNAKDTRAFFDPEYKTKLGQQRQAQAEQQQAAAPQGAANPLVRLAAQQTPPAAQGAPASAADPNLQHVPQGGEPAYDKKTHKIVGYRLNGNYYGFQ